jgi:hypothetical protein
MNREHMWEYAEHVIGFPIRPGTDIFVDADCTGTDTRRGTHFTLPGARGRVTAMKMLSYPDQLTISVKIFVEGEDNVFIRQIFTENDPPKQFPFRKYVSPEDEKLAAEAASAEVPSEAEAQADAKPAQVGHIDPPLDANPSDKPDAYEEWHGRHYGDY